MTIRVLLRWGSYRGAHSTQTLKYQYSEQFRERPMNRLHPYVHQAYSTCSSMPGHPASANVHHYAPSSLYRQTQLIAYRRNSRQTGSARRTSSETATRGVKAVSTRHQHPRRIFASSSLSGTQVMTKLCSPSNPGNKSM